MENPSSLNRWQAKPNVKINYSLLEVIHKEAIKAYNRCINEKPKDCSTTSINFPSKILLKL